MAKIYKFGEFVTKGEEKAAEVFQKSLPEKWSIICNKQLIEANGRSHEIDFILLGHHCIYVIEEKSYTGKIEIYPERWILDRGDTFYSPFYKVNMDAKRLAGNLKKKFPMIKDIISGGHFVWSFVLLSQPKQDIIIKTKDVQTKDRLLFLEDACEKLIKFDSTFTITSIASIKNDISLFLQGIPNRPSVPQKISMFNIVEKIYKPYIIAKTYSAKHEILTDKDYILKVYSLETLVSEEDKKNQKNKIYHDTEALRKLENTFLVPEIRDIIEIHEGALIVCPYLKPEGEVLASLLKRGKELSTEKALKISLELLKSLEQIHKEGIIHRNINPLSIYISQIDPIKITITDFDLSRLSDEETISHLYEDLDFKSFYMAPEVSICLGFAEETSDLFSVGIILYEMITGELPEDKKIDSEKLKKNLDKPYIQKIDEIYTFISELTQEDYKLRTNITNARQAIDKLSLILPPSDPEAIWKKGEIIDKQYEIQKLLGKSKISLTYLAQDIVNENYYILKCLRTAFQIFPDIQKEAKILCNLSNPGIVKLITACTPEKPYQFVYDYIEGPTIAEKLKEGRIPEDSLAILGKHLLGTLVYLEENDIQHCDISPKNIIYSQKKGLPVIVDFGLARHERQLTSSLAGTPKYWPPEIIKEKQLNKTIDRYALAIVLYQLATGEIPFEKTSSGDFDKTRLIKPDKAILSESVWKTLAKAMSPDKKDRFYSATDMLEDWNMAFITKEPVVLEGGTVINPWVRKLQKIYRNSKLGNQENRGLDSEFAREGYIPTFLDLNLLPKILNKEFSLILLSGNPGDGKTAFLEKVEEELINKRAYKHRKDFNGWHYELDGHNYFANYDASESHQGKSSNEILNQLLINFQGDNVNLSVLNKTVLLAINDGRLAGYFLNNPDYKWLGNQINQILNNGQKSVNKRILLVNLKWRSLVSLKLKEPDTYDGFFDRTMNYFLKENEWKICSQCSLKKKCPIKFNIDTLSDPISGKEVIKRLKTLFSMIILRGRHQLTIRDLRSILSYILVNIYSCAELHEHENKGTSHKEWLDLLYFNSAFNPLKESDEFLEELSQYDPSEVPYPKLERKIHHNRILHRNGWLDKYLMYFNRHSELIRLINYQILDFKYYYQVKRWFFFESEEHTKNWNNFQNGEETFTWKYLLSYRHFEKFIKALYGEMDCKTLRNYLVEGITKSDGLVEQEVIKNRLCLKTNENEKQELVVFRQYPEDNFICEIENPTDVSWLETSPRYLLFRHKSGSPKLLIGLDLFEILMRFRNGYQPDSEEIKTFLLDLGQFKAQLLREEANEIVLLESGRRLHRVIQQNGKIVRMEK